MYEFDEWLASCPVSYSTINFRDVGDEITITFNVGESEEEE